MKPWLSSLTLGILFSAMVSAEAPKPAADSLALENLAQEYVAAQFGFERARLEAISSPAFVEISPKGEVDERETMLGFYDSSKARPAPPFELDDVVVRISGNTAVITQRLTIGTPPRAMSMTQLLLTRPITN